MRFPGNRLGQQDAGGVEFWQALWVHVVSILRGRRRINIPGASVRLFPLDKIQVIATDEELNVFGEEMNKLSTIAADAVEKVR